ncbi:MAG TPA: hypothetical protein PKA88_24080 [Polyangiaceae bacterium]|nr:hypothetical protein [Polyangiaceae bacterium]HMR73997.1 hypothetical protein [Polyangiaceae bacterium]
MTHQRDLPSIVLLLTLGLFACKRSSDAAASASAEPAEVPVAPVATDPVPAPTATTEEPAAASPTPGATTITTTKPTAQDAGAAKDAAAPAKDAAPSKPSGPSKECVQKCQSLMQGCLSPGVTDAGVPKLPDAVKCQQAFTECQAVCK